MKFFESIVALGDIHGNLGPIRKLNDILKSSLIIQVGDFGVSRLLFYNLNLELKKRGNLLYVIRGNHEENIDLFTGQVETNIYLLPDYHYEQINNSLFLFVGGGISLDRAKRIEFAETYPSLITYYDVREPVKYDASKIVGNVDYLISHTAARLEVEGYLDPSKVRWWSRDDKLLVQDLDKENAEMEKLLEDCISRGMKKHIFGHFHVRVRRTSKLYSHDVEFVGLDINESIQIL